MEFWKKENGDRFKINSPIFCQRYGLKLSHQSYLTHLNTACITDKALFYSEVFVVSS